MSNLKLITSEPNQQQYALKVTNAETGQTNLASYNGSPILTTYLEELIDYTARLVHLFQDKIYTISLVTEVTIANEEVNEKVKQYKRLDKVTQE